MELDASWRRLKLLLEARRKANTWSFLSKGGKKEILRACIDCEAGGKKSAKECEREAARANLSPPEFGRKFEKRNFPCPLRCHMPVPSSHTSRAVVGPFLFGDWPRVRRKRDFIEFVFFLPATSCVCPRLYTQGDGPLFTFFPGGQSRTLTHGHHRVGGFYKGPNYLSFSLLYIAW